MPFFVCAPDEGLGVGTLVDGGSHEVGRGLHRLEMRTWQSVGWMRRT